MIDSAFLTDCGRSPSSFAISLLVRPEAMPRTMSRSRDVRVRCGGFPATYWPISLLRGTATVHVIKRGFPPERDIVAGGLLMRCGHPALLGISSGMRRRTWRALLLGGEPCSTNGL